MNRPVHVHPFLVFAILAFFNFMPIAAGPANAAVAASGTNPPRAAERDRAIQIIRAVGAEGQGNEKATAAWKELSAGDVGFIVPILDGMDGASPLALNWLRSAVDTITARALSAKQPLPVAALEKYLAIHSHAPRARRLAYELIARADPTRAAELMKDMLNDPSNELRRDAVGQVIDRAKVLAAEKKKDAAVDQFAKALQAARDVDQVETIAKAMKELGQPVNLSHVFGWLADWKVVGPFNNVGGVGFAETFPPETKVDLQAEHTGKQGPVRWVSLSATNDYGLVDLNGPLGALKGVTGYAYTEVISKESRPVELRLGSKNGWKLWFNGAFIFGRDEYHRGAEIDQYRFPVTLKPGRNTILVKVCQNEQTEDWTKEWEFQLRITDAEGTPVRLATR